MKPAILNWFVKNTKKTDAGALQYVLIISVVIAILMSMFIYAGYVNGILIFQSSLQTKLIDNVNSGKILLENEKHSFLENTSLSLFGEDQDSIHVRKKSWGLYNLITIVSSQKQYSAGGNFLYGVQTDDYPVLYLQNNALSLTVSGNSLLHGACKLPQRGIVEERLSGDAARRAGVLVGKWQVSEKDLPRLRDDIVPEILTKPSGVNSLLINDIKGDSLIHSFSEETMYVEVTDNSLSGRLFVGNIVIYSDKKLIIENNTILHDVIVKAPEIIVERNFCGSAQFFADFSITVEKGCKLYYPSILCITSEQDSSTLNTITIDENSLIAGGVVVLPGRHAGKPRISIEGNAIVYGLVYSSYGIKMKGKTYGSVYCEKIYQSSMYENYLHNVTMSDEVPNGFAFPVLFDDEESQVFIKQCNGTY